MQILFKNQIVNYIIKNRQNHHFFKKNNHSAKNKYMIIITFCGNINVNCILAKIDFFIKS